MERFILSLSSLLIIIIFSSCKQELTCQDIKEKYFSLTENLNSRKDTLNFIENLDKLIEQNPLCVKAFQVRGYFKMIGGEFSSAKTDFLNSLRENENGVYSNYCLSGLYNIEERNDSALLFIENAIKMKSRGKYVVNSNNYFKQYFDISYGDLIFQRGLIYHEKGKLGVAKKDFLNAIYHDYDKGEAYAHLAVVSLALNNVDSACYYQRLAKQNSYDVENDPVISKACTSQPSLAKPTLSSTNQ
jgi:tetratricopeptide (TPR) repeat protein